LALALNTAARSRNGPVALEFLLEQQQQWEEAVRSAAIQFQSA